MPAAKPFDPFCSERLIYRAVEDTPSDEYFVHTIQRDAEAQSGASYGLLRPESKKASNEFKQHVAEKCLLGAIICLPLPDNTLEPGVPEEGRQRDWMWFNGGWHDHVLYGMLEDEWREMQRKAGKDV
ncbi:acyl-CoA N-acyltransferase [Hypoxylon cercidicola]|nr:acyl-CoA N-acyltransferase [Hypoxylon cercidicola]